MAKAKEVADKLQEEAMKALSDSILASKQAAEYKKISQNLKESSSSTTNSSASQSKSLNNSAIIRYKAAVTMQINENWYLPEGQEWDKNLQTQILVTINRQGIASSHEMNKKSNNKLFNQFVSDAFEKSLPLPPLPADLTEDQYNLQLTFFPQGLL